MVGIEQQPGEAQCEALGDEVEKLAVLQHKGLCPEPHNYRGGAFSQRNTQSAVLRPSQLL